MNKHYGILRKIWRKKILNKQSYNIFEFSCDNKWDFVVKHNFDEKEEKYLRDFYAIKYLEYKNTFHLTSVTYPL